MKSDLTITIHAKIKWRTLFRAAFMRIFCKELYLKFVEIFEPQVEADFDEDRARSIANGELN